MLQIPELLAPAGDLERLRYAINYGADAVYCSLPEFGMRSAPANFTPEQLAEGVIYAHARGRKVYLTMNTLPTNEEADRLPEAIKAAAAAGVDAFIVADLGVLEACKQFAPEIDVHMSTQTGITNWAAARAAYNMGAKRVVLAREMSLQDIATLRDKTPPELEIEAFVHGAMCMSISGRCLLSNYMAGRDANRGQCAQPCRWKYYLSEETRPGQLYEIGENENGSYILNANDLCTAPFIDLICKAGVDSLKIEGRAKTFYYVASVTAAYRKALDQYLADPLNDNFELSDDVLAELTRTSHRHYSPGFYFGREQARQATDSATYIREWEFVGTVESWENGVASCQQRGKWSLGDTLEVLCPDGRSIPLHPEWIKNEAGESVESTPHAMEKYTIHPPGGPPKRKSNGKEEKKEGRGIKKISKFLRLFFFAYRNRYNQFDILEVQSPPHNVQAFVIGMILITLVVTVPGLHNIFKVQTLTLSQLLTVYGLAALNLPIIQMIKAVRAKFRK